ncbi:MAG: DUF2312 domain-containing protein [Stellaceae bacterium]
MACHMTNGARSTRRKPLRNRRSRSLPRKSTKRRTLGAAAGGTRIARATAKSGEAGPPAEVAGVAGERLKSFIERVERLEEEKRALAEDIKEVYSEAKGAGFDIKTMRQIVRLRKLDEEDRDEQEALLETYLRAIGMKPERTGRRAAE